MHYRGPHATNRGQAEPRFGVSKCQPSGRCREFPGKPADRPRFERVRCNDADLNVIAFRAFEQPVLETGRSRRNPFQHHPRLAAGTARALNHRQEWLG
jgi:hypothetical protein